MRAKEEEYGFGDLTMSRRKVKEEFFNQIDKVIDWKPVRAIIEEAYTKGKTGVGRPCYDSIVLFKIELLRTWYGLSDGEVEDQVNDRLSFTRFVGISMDSVSPDSTTICRFRNVLSAANVYERLLDEINRQLEERGVVVKKGAIVDASVTESPRRPRGKKEYVVVEDRREEEGAAEAEEAFLKEKEKPNVDKEARWVKKAGKLRFGYKRHTVTTADGLILAEETTPANENDIKHMGNIIEKAHLPAGTPVLADKGYDSAENRKMLSGHKLKSRIMHRAKRSRPLSKRESKVNIAISKARYCIERTFGSIRRWFSGGVARYVGLRKTHAQHIMEAISYNLYRTPGLIVSKGLIW